MTNHTIGQRWETAEIIAGFDLEPFTRHAYCIDDMDSALIIFAGFVAGKLFTARVGGTDEPALDQGIRACHVHPGCLCEAWDAVGAFIAACPLGALDAFDDDQLDRLGTKLAFSMQGEGTGLWDVAEFRHLEIYSRGLRHTAAETWEDGMNFLVPTDAD